MSKGDTFEADMLDLVFKNIDIAGIGDAGGLRGSVAAGSLYIALHTADPGEGGNQQTSEIAYTSYARVAVTRGAGFTRTVSSISPAADVVFPAGTGGSGTATHWSVGSASSGTGKVLYKGSISPTIVCGNGITPRLTTASAVTED